MFDLFSSERLVDLILLLVIIEVGAIAIYRRSTGRGIALKDLLPNILAGVFLLLALRAALAGGGWMPISAFLSCAGIAHVIDIGRRWHR